MTPHRWSALAAGTTLSLAAAMLTPSAASADEPAGTDEPAGSDRWVSVTPEGYHRFTLPYQQVRELVGAEPVTVELQGNIGPAGTWADLAAELQGSQYVTSIGPLPPGLYHYQFTATLVDRTKISFREPGTPDAVTSHEHLSTLFVPGEGSRWFADAATPGTVTPIEYGTAEQRSAFVWTPPGHDGGPLPVLLLLADASHAASDWLELGRVPQILDNLLADGAIEPMAVVMASVADARREIREDLLPAARRAFPGADDGVRLADVDLAVAGIGTGAAQALELLASEPGLVRAAGVLSIAPSDDLAATLSAAAPQLSAAEPLVRVYVGNVLDPAYDATLDLMTTLEGIPHESDGVTPGSGGTWDTWRGALRDFVARLHQDAVVGPRAGHLPLDAPYEAPRDVTTPHVDANGIVTFVTGEQWADAKDVTVWGNWAPNGAWLRVPMERDGERWRVSMGPLDGFYYYRYVVDGVDHKDPADTVNTLTGVSPLFVPGETDRLLADVPEGQGGSLEVLTYASEVVPGERSAYVWTPPGYDPQRAEPYPVLYLNHGGDQSWGDWVEVGRARQIFDNLTLEGAVVPMVVVMGDGNVPDFPAELLDNLAPAAEAKYHIATDGPRRAIAGLSMGAMHTLTTWVTRPGEFAYVGAFSGFFFQEPEFDAAQVNAATTLARIYTGDSSDFTYENTLSLMAMLDERGVDYEFPGATPGPHGFDTWQANLIDFAPLLFQDLAEGQAADDGASRTDAVGDAGAHDGSAGAAGARRAWLWAGAVLTALIAAAAVALTRRRRSP